MGRTAVWERKAVTKKSDTDTQTKAGNGRKLASLRTTTKIKRGKLALDHVAYHEAGHAVAAFHLRLPIKRATIVPGKDHLGMVVPDVLQKAIRSRAYVRVRGTDEYRLRKPYDHPYIVRKLTMLAAGEMATRHFGGPSGSGSDDYQQSVKLLKSLGADEATINRKMRYAAHSAARMVIRLRARIRAVAAVLLEKRTLNHDEIRFAIGTTSAVLQAGNRKGAG